MRKSIQILISLLVALMLMTAGSVFAQDGPTPCAGDQVAGTVIAVDETTGTVTVDTGEGLCTVTLGADDYDHPIVALLGAYFDDLSPESLTAALGEVDKLAVLTEEGEWVWAEEGDEGAVPVRVIAVIDNGDGTYTIQLMVDGLEEPIEITESDADLVSDLNAALETLAVMWTLNEDGTVSEVGDQIAAYHEAGMGFGVLTKLYAIAQESQEACAEAETAEDETCGVTVEELVAAVQGGAGMGELFKEYGKPSILGVGHVRKALKGEKMGKPEWAGPKKDKTPDEELDPEEAETIEVGGDEQKGNKPDWAGPKDKAPNDKKGGPKGKKDK